LCGCGYYSTSSSLAPHIKNVSIPLFDNETQEVDLVEKITDAVTNGIFSDGHLKIVGEFNSDAVLRGNIIKVVDEPDTYSREEDASKFRIRIFISLEFFDRKKNEILWEEPSIEGFGIYDTDEDRDSGIQDALNMLAERIVNRLITDW